MSRKHLRDLCVVEYGKSPNEIRTHQSPIPIYGTGGRVGFASRSLFDGPIVVVARKGTLGNPIYSSGPCWVIDTAYAVHPKDEIDAKWLFYSLDDFDLESLNEATGVPSISRDYLYKIRLHTPPLPEQKKIARILTTVDNLIEKTEALIEKYKAIKQGMMHDLFTRGVDQNGKLRPPYEEAPHLYKESPLGWIPKEWDILCLSNMAEITKLAGYEFTKLMNYVDDGEIIALRALNIKNECLNLSNIQRISQKVSDALPRSKVNSEDILITYIGAYIGDILRITEDDRYHLAPNVAKITVGKEVHAGYLEWVLRTEIVRCQMEAYTVVTATPSLTMSQIRKIRIPLPSEKNEQQLITQRIVKLNQFLLSENLYKSTLSSIKSGLMQDLLTGKVRVKVDKTEEELANA